MGIRGRVRWVSKGNQSQNGLSPILFTVNARPRTRFARPRLIPVRAIAPIHAKSIARGRIF